MGAAGAGETIFSEDTVGDACTAGMLTFAGGLGLPQETANKSVRQTVKIAMRHRRIIYRYYLDLW